MQHFSRINRSLRADNGLKSTTFLITSMALLAAWLFWAFKAQITRYEVSDSARLEVASSAHPVQSNVAGRLISLRMALGKKVQAGDVLAELENHAQRLSLEEEQVHRASLEPQLTALQAQMVAEEKGGADDRQVLDLSTAGAREQYREADASASLAEKEADRANKLHAAGIMSDADAQRANADAQSKRAAAENLRLTIARLEPELAVRQSDRDVRIRQIREAIAKLQADIETSSATINRLEYETERTNVRAPISGDIAEVADLLPGSHVTEGQQLGVIVPDGKLQVIADFQPSAALGKIRSGQTAVVRLEGFPWAQYGTLSARVLHVAGEIRDGKIRVELAVNSAIPSRIPVQHGLPGSVEVQVDRVTPIALLLRSAGGVVEPR